MNDMPYIGAHVSAAGGLEHVFERAGTLGVSAIQLFGSSPRQWNVVLPSQDTRTRWREAWKASEVREVFLHAPYLCNIAHPDKELRAKSIRTLGGHLQIADMLHTQGVIFHIGTGKGEDRESSYRHLAQSVREIFQNVPGDTFLIIENSAGEGDKIGATLEELARIVEILSSPRIGVCIDTAHVFASGALDEYTDERIHTFFDTFDQLLGIDMLKALHVNDSKVPAHAKKDRHENIGSGHIGLDGFRALAREKRLSHLPWLLEVPGFEGLGPDKRNVEFLASCFT